MKTQKPFSLTPAWPDHLPEKCPCCGHHYDIRINLEIGPNRLGRFLRRFAPFMAVTALLTSMILLATADGSRTAPTEAGFARALFMIAPAVVLHALAGTLPKKTRLSCHKCGAKGFYDLPETKDNRMTVVNE